MIEYLDLVDADFRTFYGYHGIADDEFPEHLSSGRFFKLCEQLIHYRGAVRGYLTYLYEQEERHEPGGGYVPGQSHGSTQNVPDYAVTAHSALQGDPASPYKAPVFNVRKAGPKDG